MNMGLRPIPRLSRYTGPRRPFRSFAGRAVRALGAIALESGLGSKGTAWGAKEQ